MIEADEFERRLQALGRDPLRAAEIAFAPGVGCLPHSALARLGRGKVEPTASEWEHLESCHACRTAVIALAVGRPFASHPLQSEQSWIEARSRGASWAELRVRIRAETAADRRSLAWRLPILLAAAAAVVAVVAVDLDRSRDEVRPLRTAIAGNRDDLSLSLRSANEAEEFYVRVIVERASHVRLFALDSASDIHPLTLDEELPGFSMLLEPELEAGMDFGGYPTRLSAGPDEKTVEFVLVLSSPRDLGTEPAEAVPLFDPSGALREYAEEIASVWRERFDCSVDLLRCPAPP